MQKKILFVLKFIFVSASLLLMYHEFFVTEEYWNGVYYPGGNLSGNVIYSPRFVYREECVGWAINEKGLRPEDANVSPADLWECNKNCKISPAYGTLVNANDPKYRHELFNENRGPLYVCDDGGFDGGDWLRDGIIR